MIWRAPRTAETLPLRARTVDVWSVDGGASRAEGREKRRGGASEPGTKTAARDANIHTADSTVSSAATTAPIITTHSVSVHDTASSQNEPLDLEYTSTSYLIISPAPRSPRGPSGPRAKAAPLPPPRGAAPPPSHPSRPLKADNRRWSTAVERLWAAGARAQRSGRPAPPPRAPAWLLLLRVRLEQHVARIGHLSAGRFLFTPLRGRAAAALAGEGSMSSS